MMNIGEGDGVQPCLPVAASSWCCSYSSRPLGLAWLFGAHQNLPEHGLGAVGTASPTLSPLGDVTPRCVQVLAVLRLCSAAPSLGACHSTGLTFCLRLSLPTLAGPDMSLPRAGCHR